MALSDAVTAANLEGTISKGWDEIGAITPKTEGPVRMAVQQAMKMLDNGTARVAEHVNGGGGGH